jgi:hypothetical protein
MVMAMAIKDPNEGYSNYTIWYVDMFGVQNLHYVGLLPQTENRFLNTIA